MEDTLTSSHATFSQVFGRQGQLMQASELQPPHARTRFVLMTYQDVDARTACRRHSSPPSACLLDPICAAVMQQALFCKNRTRTQS